MDEIDDSVLKSVSNMVKKSLENSEIDIMLGLIQQAGLCQEFEDFIADDKNKFICAREYFTEFAKLYPDKFFIVPEAERYHKMIVVERD